MVGKQGFKVGDKVKLKGNFCGISGDDIGQVVSVSHYIRIAWTGYLRARLDDIYPHLAREIEHTVRVGEQLEFAFMQMSEV